MANVFKLFKTKMLCDIARPIKMLLPTERQDFSKLYSKFIFFKFSINKLLLMYNTVLDLILKYWRTSKNLN